MTGSEKYPKGSDGLPCRPTHAYAHDKYRYFGIYMKMFTTAMQNKWDHLIYVDLYSGVGRSKILENGEELNGSAMLSLEYPFTKFVFNDLDGDKIDVLRQRVSSGFEEKESICYFTTYDANVCVQKLYEEKMVGRSNELCLILSDPNDLSPYFGTIEFISELLKADLVFHLSYGIDFQRNLKAYIQKESSKLDLFIGDNRWRELADPITPSEIMRHYFKRLGELGYQVHSREESFVPANLPIRSKKNRILYYLFILSKHPLGEKFSKEVAKYIPRQMSLFN